MQTELLPVNEESIEKGGRIIREGGLVGFPTETVYGLGANALDPEAVTHIFEAKGRPQDNPLIVHVSCVEEIPRLIKGEIPEMAGKLMDAFWPGPMTLIFKKADDLNDVVTAGLDSVGIRLPAHEAARLLIKKSGCPIAAPSANHSGRPSPTTAKHVMDDMDGRIPLILDGGACQVGVESTVIDVTGNVPRVLRPGGITPEMIADAVGGCEVDGAVLRPLKEGERPRSPGMKYRHYAPKGTLTLFEGEAEAVAKTICSRYDECGNAAILCLPEHKHLYGDRRVLLLGSDDTASGVAQALFAVLRQLDDEDIDLIFSEAIAATGVGLAVMNRLGRAAAFHIEKV